MKTLLGFGNSYSPNFGTASADEDPQCTKTCECNYMQHSSHLSSNNGTKNYPSYQKDDGRGTSNECTVWHLFSSIEYDYPETCSELKRSLYNQAC